eukprot:992521-Pyramimonas_sp.AAC.1
MEFIKGLFQHGHGHSHGDGHSHDGIQTIVTADGKVLHSHDGLKPHFHEPIYSPGEFRNRAKPLMRKDFAKRSFTIGIGGPVGTGYGPIMPLGVSCRHVTVLCAVDPLRVPRELPPLSRATDPCS